MLIVDLISLIFFGFFGGVLVVVYIELSVGVVVGVKMGFVVVVVGLLFFVVMFFLLFVGFVLLYVIVLVLMYVGLLMFGSVSKLYMDDMVDVMLGFVCVVFIVLIVNIVMGIMFGFLMFVIGCFVSGEFCKFNVGIVFIVVVFVMFYFGGWVI